MTKYTDISFKMHTKRVFPAANNRKDHVACVGDTIMNSTRVKSFFLNHESRVGGKNY